MWFRAVVMTSFAFIHDRRQRSRNFSDAHADAVFIHRPDFDACARMCEQGGFAIVPYRRSCCSWCKHRGEYSA
jgi:hypothetical protein